MTAELVLPLADAAWEPDELIDEMLASWAVKNPASRQTARYTIAAFAAWLGRDLLDATSVECRAWLEHRAGEVGPATCVKNWSQLTAFYRACETHTTDPLDGRRSPMRDVPQPWAPQWTDTHAATGDEYRAVMAVFDKRTSLGLRNAVMVSLMYRSGLRVSEVARSELAHLDVTTRQLWVPDTKNGRPRRPPLAADTLELLRAYLNPRRRGDQPGPLAVNVGGRRTSAWMTTSAVQNVVKKAAKAAGVPVSPHSLRRGWCVDYMTNGGSEAMCMEIAGWTSNVMLLRYLADARAEAAQSDFDRVNARRATMSREQRSLRALR